MKHSSSLAAITIIEAVLILAIAAGFTSLAGVWTYSSVQASMVSAEMNSMKQAFAACNDKILETARTGSSNRCVFPVDKGKLSAAADGLYYSLLGGKEICSPHGWFQIDEKRHIWQKCDAADSKRIYQLRWSWPKEVNIEGRAVYGNFSGGEDVNFNETVFFRTINVQDRKSVV